MKTEYTPKYHSSFHYKMFLPVVFSLLSLIACKTLGGNPESNIPHVFPSGASTDNDLASPVVFVMANDPDKRKEGYGAVIGDGSLVVTAYHIVFNSSEIGIHSMPLFPVVISPYLGDTCYGRILAADREFDLAILEIPWVGHPSYTLASDQDLHQMDKVALFSYRSEVVKGKRHILEDIQTERLPIRDLSSRHGIVSQVFLKGLGQLSEGWSGCPIVFEEKRLLVGCFTTKHGVRVKIHLSIWPDESGYNSKLQKYACGPAAGWMRKLIIEANAGEKLNGPDRGLEAPPDSDKALKHLLKAIEYEVSEEKSMKEKALKKSKLFLELRPESVLGTIKHAGHLADMDQPDSAEELYRRAIEFDSSQVYALMAYGHFLEENGRPSEALAQYRKGEMLEPNHSLVAYSIARVITYNDIEEDALSQIEKYIKKYPENGHLLASPAEFHLKQGQTDRAIETTKAVIMLMPENVRYRRILAIVLERNQRDDEAEIQLRDILKLVPDDPEAHFWLATFLSKHRPDAREEAIRLAKRALYLHKDRKGPEKAKIEKLLSNLKDAND